MYSQNIGSPCAVKTLEHWWTTYILTVKELNRPFHYMSGKFSTYLQYKDFTAFATQILCVDLGNSSRFCKQILKLGGSGFGRRHMFWGSWVRILARPYTGWHILHLFVVKIMMFVWKDENKWKRGRFWCTSLKYFEGSLAT